jgi:hypothetical protein
MFAAGELVFDFAHAGLDRAFGIRHEPDDPTDHRDHADHGEDEKDEKHPSGRRRDVNERLFHSASIQRDWNNIRLRYSDGDCPITSLNARENVQQL